MNLKKSIFFLHIIVLFTRCAGNHEKNTIREISIATKDITKGFLLSDIIEHINYIPLLSADSVMIVDVSRIIEYKNQFIVFDPLNTKNVLKFDAKGNLILKYGSIGFKESQFSQPFDIALVPSERSLYVLDNPADIKLKKYDILDGTYKSTIDFHKNLGKSFYADRFARVGNDWVFHTTGFEKFKFIRTDASVGEILDKQILTRIQNIQISYQNYFSFTKDKVLYRIGGNDTIFNVSSKGLDPYLYIDFEKKVTDDMYLKVSKKYSSDFLFFNLPKIFPDKMYQILSYEEFGNVTYLKFSYNTMYYYAFFNKNTGHKIIVAEKDLINNVTFQNNLILFGPAQNDKDALGIILPEQVVAIKSNLKRYKFSPAFSKDLSKNIDQLQGKTNPIIIKLNFKNF